MDEIKKAELLANKYIQKHPDYKEGIEELLELMICEIEDGSSPDEELRSFTQSLEELLD